MVTKQADRDPVAEVGVRSPLNLSVTLNQEVSPIQLCSDGIICKWWPKEAP